MKYRFKLIFFLTGIAIIYTSCIKFFERPKPIDKSVIIEAANISTTREVTSYFVSVLNGYYGGVDISSGLHFKPNFGVYNSNGSIILAGTNSINTCGGGVDTSFTYSGVSFGSQVDSKLKYKEAAICINNIVYGHHVTDSLELSSSKSPFESLSKLGEDIISQTLSTTDTSELTLNGAINYNVNASNTNSPGFISTYIYNFKLNSVVLNPSNKELVGGTATFQETIPNQAVKNGTIEVLGSDTFKFTIGGKVYVYNWSTDEVNGKK